MASLFLNLVCSVYVGTITTELNYTFMTSSNSSFHFPDSIRANHELVKKNTMPPAQDRFSPPTAVPGLRPGGVHNQLIQNIMLDSGGCFNKQYISYF